MIPKVQKMRQNALSWRSQQKPTVSGQYFSEKGKQPQPRAVLVTLVRAKLMGLCPGSEIMGCSGPSIWPAHPSRHLSVSGRGSQRTRVSLECHGEPCYPAQLNSRGSHGPGVCGHVYGQEGGAGDRDPSWRSVLMLCHLLHCHQSGQKFPMTRSREVAQEHGG